MLFPAAPAVIFVVLCNGSATLSSLTVARCGSCRREAHLLICPAKSAQELLAEFRSTGRQEPFEEIVRRYAAMVFHVCFQVLKNRHDAEDATQAVFLTLAVQGKTSKEIRNIGPWLQQVAKRMALDLRKAKKRRVAREQRHGISNSNGGSSLALGNGLDGQELRHILSEELNHLAPKYRLPLILHYFG